MKKLYFSLVALVFYCASASAQNTCATAQVLPGAGVYTCGNINGNPPPFVCSGVDLPGAGEWYEYTPAQNYYVTITSDLAGNSGDSDVSIFSGTCSSLTCVAGNDDGPNNTMSVVSFYVTAGTTYYIVFDNAWSSGGFQFQLIETQTSAPPITFTDDPTGLEGSAYNNCIVDMNGDYLDDIVSVKNNSLRILRQLSGGGFSDTTIALPSLTNAPGWSIAAGDLDRNGFNDLVFGGYSGASILIANNTGTGYTEFADGNYIFCQRTNMVDINGDGNLDVFVCHDVDPNVYYINDGNNNFTYNQGGLGDHPEGGNYGSVWVDYDNDGDPDLFIAKCRGGQSTARINELHRNDGNGVFVNVAAEANMADSVQTWSSAWADYDNDGDMDALIGASSSADGMHKLMRNNGDGTFTDVTAGSGWDVNTSLNVEHITFDFDNNGYADVFGGGNKIMLNNGDMTFTPMSVGFTPGPCGDIDNNGFIDVLDGTTIHRNNGNSNNYVKLSLQGVQSNANGIGARVELYSDLGKQIRDVRSGEGFRNMHSLNVHFGIGANASIDSIHVIWPSGIVDYLFDTTINTTLHIIEGNHPYPPPPVDTPTTINDITKEGISIYPNPANDIIQINNRKGLKLYYFVIYNTAGAVIRKEKLKEDRINIHDLPEGNYLLSIMTDDNRRIEHRFVKVKR